MERKLPLITSVFLNVTNACNLACRYCFVEQHPNFMSYETAKETADFLIRNAAESGDVPAINFFGGEPTLCWDSIIVPLSRYIREEYGKPFRLSMTSNCTLLDEERIRFMKEHEIGLLFSIDGDRETQDYNRPSHGGGSSFDLLEDKISTVALEFPGTTFRSTVVPETCGNVFHNILFAYKHGYRSFFIVPNVFEPWPSEARDRLKGELRKYSNWMMGWFRQGQTPPLSFSDYGKALSNIKRINAAVSRGLFREEASCGACAKCGLGASRFAAVDYKGNLYACQELVSPKDGENSVFYIGNISSGVDDARREALMASYHTKEDRTGQCMHCRLNRVCKGGCVANNHMITGDINHTPEMWCWWENALLDEAIYIMNTMGAEANPAFTEYWRSVGNG